MTDKLEEYRQKVAGTNIDPKSLLSTDYFNTFNSVAMLLDMLPSTPELLVEIDQWEFYDYVGHFKHSGLDFAPLAIEAYKHAPPGLKKAFEAKIVGMKLFVEDIARTLRHLHQSGEKQAFANLSLQAVILIRGMIEEGNAIVHGSATLDQSAIDKMF